MNICIDVLPLGATIWLVISLHQLSALCGEMHDQSVPPSVQLSVTFLQSSGIKASLIIMRNPPSSRPVLSPCIKCLLTRLKWKWRFYPSILINLAHLSLCSGIWEAVILALGPHPVVCGSATVLIYAVAWMQLFPVTTVARSHRDALGLNRNRIPVSFMFIAGACPWCGI